MEDQRSAIKADGWILYPLASQQDDALPNGKENEASVAKRSIPARGPGTPPTYCTRTTYTPPPAPFHTPQITASGVRQGPSTLDTVKTASERQHSFRTADFAATNSDTALSDSESSTCTEIRTVTGTKWTLSFAPEPKSSDTEELSAPRCQLLRTRMSPTIPFEAIESSDTGYTGDSEMRTGGSPTTPEGDYSDGEELSTPRFQPLCTKMPLIRRSITPESAYHSPNCPDKPADVNSAYGASETVTSLATRQQPHVRPARSDHRSQAWQSTSSQRFEAIESSDSGYAGDFELPTGESPTTPEADSSDSEELSTPRPQPLHTRMSSTPQSGTPEPAHQEVETIESSDSGYAGDSEMRTRGSTIKRSGITRSARHSRDGSEKSSDSGYVTAAYVPPQKHGDRPSAQSYHKSHAMQEFSLPKSEATETLPSAARPAIPRLKSNQDHKKHHPHLPAIKSFGRLPLVFFAGGFLLCIAITERRPAVHREELAQVKQFDSSNHIPRVGREEVVQKDQGIEWIHSLDARTGQRDSMALESMMERCPVKSMPSKVSTTTITTGNDGTQESLRDKIDRYLGWAWLANYD